MGSRLARSVFDIYDAQANQEGAEEELPSFYLPLGQGGILPGDIIYYHIFQQTHLSLIRVKLKLKTEMDSLVTILILRTEKVILLNSLSTELV